MKKSFLKFVMDLDKKKLKNYHSQKNVFLKNFNE